MMTGAIPQASVFSQTTPNYSFRDDFNYYNMSQMETAGWSICGSPDLPRSDYQVTVGLLTMVTDWNNGYSAGVCWSKVPAGVSNWSVSTRGAWVGNNVAGTIEIVVTTTGHTYSWDADGVFQQYLFSRDGTTVWTGPRYWAQLGVWHDLRMDFVKGSFYLYFDELPMATVPVQDTGTNITGVVLRSQAGTDNSFTHVETSSVDPNAPDFTLIAGPTTQNIPVGQNSTFTISLTSLNGFSGIVNLASSVSPGGSNSLEVSLPHSVILASGSSSSATLTAATFQVISASTFNIRINATSGTLYHAVQVSATVTAPSQGQSFTLRAAPSSLILRQGGNGLWNTTIITLYISPVSGFTGTVALSVGTPSPPGPVVVISPGQILITGNKTFTATLSFQGAFLSGTWQFGITAVSAGLSVDTGVSVDFVPSYFNAGITPSWDILVASGFSSRVSLNLVSVNGYASNVSFSYYSVFALPANPPAISFSPASLTLIPDGTLNVAVTVSASGNTPTGPYTFIIVVHGGWATTDTQVNVYVVSHAYTPGIGVGTTATYNVSLSNFPGVSPSVTLTVTNVTGPVVSYTQSFYVDNVLTNTTTGSVNVVTGDHTGTVFVPFPFVASGLQAGDYLFPAAPYGSISITSTSTSSLAGASRLSFSAGTGITINPVQFSAAWDSSTGILWTLDGTVPINSTSVTAHYRLVSTTAWSAASGGISVQFIYLPFVAAQFSKITFTATVTGGVPPYTYHWDFGDGQSSSQPKPIHSYVFAGSYTVTLTVTDKSGVIGTRTSTIKVSSPTINPPLFSTFAPTPGELMIGLVAIAAYIVVAITVSIIVIRGEQEKQRRLAQRSLG